MLVGPPSVVLRRGTAGVILAGHSLQFIHLSRYGSEIAFVNEWKPLVLKYVHMHACMYMCICLSVNLYLYRSIYPYVYIKVQDHRITYLCIAFFHTFSNLYNLYTYYHNLHLTTFIREKPHTNTVRLLVHTDTHTNTHAYMRALRNSLVVKYT